MDYVLAYYPTLPTLGKQRVTPYTAIIKPEPFDPSRVSTHLLNDHDDGVPALSSPSAAAILTKQLELGLNSDDLQGSFMAEFDPSALVKTLTMPAIGAAWNYLEARMTSFYTVVPPYPIKGFSRTGGPFVVVEPAPNFPYVTLTPKGADFSKDYDNYKILHPVQFNSSGTVDASSLTNSGFTEVNTGVYSAVPREMPNMGEFTPYVNASGTLTRNFTLNADILAPNTPGLFSESDFANRDSVKTIKTHIDTYPHYGIIEGSMSNTECLSSIWVTQQYGNSYYGLENAFGGDTWLQSDGSNNSHPLEPLANGTVVYWVALYNGEEFGKKVVAPDGTLLARPVNGKKRIRCAFTLPAEVMPIADEGVLLRRCNPTWGYTKGLA